MPLPVVVPVPVSVVSVVPTSGSVGVVRPQWVSAAAGVAVAIAVPVVMAAVRVRPAASRRSRVVTYLPLLVTWVAETITGRPARFLVLLVLLRSPCAVCEVPGRCTRWAWGEGREVRAPGDAPRPNCLRLLSLSTVSCCVCVQCAKAQPRSLF